MLTSCPVKSLPATSSRRGAGGSAGLNPPTYRLTTGCRSFKPSNDGPKRLPAQSLQGPSGSQLSPTGFSVLRAPPQVSTDVPCSSGGPRRVAEHGSDDGSSRPPRLDRQDDLSSPRRPGGDLHRPTVRLHDMDRLMAQSVTEGRRAERIGIKGIAREPSDKTAEAALAACAPSSPINLAGLPSTGADICGTRRPTRTCSWRRTAGSDCEEPPPSPGRPQRQSR